MGLEIIKKAWCINPSNLSEPWFADTGIIYYGSRGQAKVQALLDNDIAVINDDSKNENWLTYLTIKVSRAKEFDIVNYHGREIKRNRIKEVEREVMIENLPEDKSYYVQDARSYVGNSVLWWALGGNGYTCDITKAHKYKGKEIKKNWRDTDIIWESEYVEKNISQHVDMQRLDKKVMV